MGQHDAVAAIYFDQDIKAAFRRRRPEEPTQPCANFVSPAASTSASLSAAKINRRARPRMMDLTSKVDTLRCRFRSAGRIRALAQNTRDKHSAWS